MYINRISNFNINSTRNQQKHIRNINVNSNSDTFSKNISFGAQSGYVLKSMYPDDKNLERYLESISKYKTLSHEKTKELFAKMAEGGPDAEKIREQLINANLRLVLYAVKKRPPSSEYPVLDMIQAGNVALMYAVNRYDCNQKCTFATFALVPIRAAINNAIIVNRETIRLPEHIRETIKKIEKKEEILTNKLLRYPNLSQLAKVMHLSVEQTKALKELTQEMLDIDMRLFGKEHRHDFKKRRSLETTGDKEYFLKEAISDLDAPTAADIVAKQEIDEALLKFFETLGPKALFILKNRYELDGETRKSYAELAKELNCTRSWVHQIEKSALKKLAKPENAEAIRTYLRDYD